MTIYYLRYKLKKGLELSAVPFTMAYLRVI